MHSKKYTWYDKHSHRSGTTPTVSILETDMFAHAAELRQQYPTAKIVIHNFANNWKPIGGHFRKTDPTQEGILFRNSNIEIPLDLYPIDRNPKQETNLILTTDVHFNYKGEQFNADVLTIAALVRPAVVYSKNGDIYRDDYNAQITLRKLMLIMKTLQQHNADYFVTGGWGLGEFDNPIYDIIRLWNEAFNSYPIPNIDFCFLDSKVATTFKRHLKICN